MIKRFFGECQNQYKIKALLEKKRMQQFKDVFFRQLHNFDSLNTFKLASCLEAKREIIWHKIVKTKLKMLAKVPCFENFNSASRQKCAS